MTVHELAARTAKAQAMYAAYKAAQHDRGVTSAAQLLDEARQALPLVWVMAACLAGVRPPSPATVAQVLTMLAVDIRIEATHAADPFRGLS
jgi:hypothetical protein